MPTPPPNPTPPHHSRYTAAKHLLSELKATLSDLQEQMESSERVAHQSEVSTKALDKLRTDLQVVV